MRAFSKITVSSLFVASALLASATAQAGHGSSPEAVLSAIRSDSPDAIASELERAEYLVCGACVPYVQPLVDHKDAFVRRAATWWLARRGVARQVYLDMLGRLSQPDSVKARNAADVLGELHAAGAIPALGAALSNPVYDAQARVAMAGALSRMLKPEAATALANALGDGEPAVRAAAAAGLRAFPQTDMTQVSALLGDGDAGVRAEAVITLGTLRASTAAAAVANLLVSDPDANVRRKAAWALGAMRAPSSAAGAALAQAAQKDTSPLVRSLAQASLSSLR